MHGTQTFGTKSSLYLYKNTAVETLLLLIFMFFCGPSSAAISEGLAGSVEDGNPFSEKACAAHLAEANEDAAFLPRAEVLEAALTAMEILRSSDGPAPNEILTVIDFSLPSTEKRFWIFDLTDGRLVLNTYVAHGQKSGDNYAENFSNTPESHQSSPGLYLTGDTYHGKHGLSLYLNGMWEGINDNAMKRHVVLHGAEYVSEDFIRAHGRLGRSYGCPAVPVELAEEVIHTIAGGSCLFIYHPEVELVDQRCVTTAVFTSGDRGAR